MATINLNPGAIFAVEPKAGSSDHFFVKGSNIDPAQTKITAENYDSRSILVNVSFVIKEANLYKQKFDIDDASIQKAGYLTFLANLKDIAQSGIAITLNQSKPADPVVFNIELTLPGSKVGGAPVKVGGAGF